MVLPMPSPTRMKSGIYYYIVRVPTDLIEDVGKKVLSETLGTKDPILAKELFSKRHEKSLSHWKALRSKPEAIPHRQLVALAGKHYQELMGMLEDEPGEPEIWETVLSHRERLALSPVQQAEWLGPTAHRLLSDAGLNADDTSFKRLIQELHSAGVQWAEQQGKRAGGDYTPDPKANRFPVLSASSQSSTSKKDVVSFDDIFMLWERDHKVNHGSPKTVSDFRQKLDSLIAFSGVSDVQRLTPKQVSDWCEDLVHEKGLSTRTVSQKYLAAVKAIMWAGVRKHKIESNPADIVKVKYTKAPKVRSSGFTDEEATAILRVSSLI